MDMTLQESIRRIIREDYSPAGKEITPNKIVVHKTSPVWRENILKTGLLVDVGDCYKTYVGYGEKCVPAIFATNSTNKRAWFDLTYDDDIWFIDTTIIPDVMWYKDRHFESIKKHIVTFQNIPSEALTLKYEGSGRSGDFLEESIRRILKEPTHLNGRIKMLGEGYEEEYEKLIFSKKYSDGFFEYCRNNIDEIVETLLSDAYYEFEVYDLIIVLTIDDLININNQRTLGEYDDDTNTLRIVMFTYFEKFLGGLDNLSELSEDEKKLIGGGIKNILVTPNNEFTRKIQSNIRKVFYHEMIHHFDNVKYGKNYSDSVNRMELIKHEIEDDEKRLGYYNNMSHEIDANFISTLSQLIDNHGEGYGDFRTFQEMFLDYFPRWEILSDVNKSKIMKRLYKFFEKL